MGKEGREGEEGKGMWGKRDGEGEVEERWGRRGGEGGLGSHVSTVTGLCGDVLYLMGDDGAGVVVENVD